MHKKKLALFSPFTAIWSHSILEAQIAKSLSKVGWNLDYITCRGLFSSMCVAMSAHGLTENSDTALKNKICSICIKSKKQLSQWLNPDETFYLDDLINETEKAEVSNLLSKLRKDDVLSFEFDGMPIGKYALYEYMLGHKKNELIFSDHESSEILIHVKNCLSAAIAFTKYLNNSKPDAVLLYNSLYSINSVCRHLAKQSNIPTYYLHHGENPSRHGLETAIGLGSPFDCTRRLIQEWKVFEHLPPSKIEYRRVTDHLISFIKGKTVFAYSNSSGAKQNIVEKLGILPGKKVLLACLSSADERFSAETAGHLAKQPALFESQIEWIKYLNKFAIENQGVHIIIRVHPREFPNKRESVKSKQAEIYEKILTNLPANVTVNWPSDSIAIYDLAEYVDVVLTSWSYAGLEMSFLGIPVVSYSKDLLWYPVDIHYHGESIDSYRDAIRAALTNGWSSEHIKKSYQWRHIFNNLNVVSTPKYLIRDAHKYKSLRTRLETFSNTAARGLDLMLINESKQLGLQIENLFLKKIDFPIWLLKDEKRNSNNVADDLTLKEELLRIYKILYPKDRPSRAHGLKENMGRFLELEISRRVKND